jgi:phage tail sheath protein FI
MPAAVSYPGVYIVEVPSGSRAIAGVPTSIAAFVGYTARGPVNEPVQVFNLGDFERAFGGLSLASELSYAVNHFFLNGGAVAWIVRVAENAAAASVMLQTAGGADTLLVTASSEGAWGNNLLIGVDYATSSPASLFNLTVTEIAEQNGRLVVLRSETHRNLSMNPDSGNFAVAAVNADSDLVTLAAQGAAGGSGTSASRPLTDADATGLNDDVRRLAISLDGGPVQEFDIFGEGESVANLAALADAIEAAVLLLQGGAGFTCEVVDGRLVATSGTSGLTSSVSFRRASVRSATAALGLGLASGGREAEGASAARPAASGTTGGRLPDFDNTVVGAGDTLTVELRDFAGTLIDDNTTVTFAAAPATPAEARTLIEAGMRTSTVAAVAQASVAVVDDALVVRAGGDVHSHTLTFTGAAATALALTGGDEFVNVASYRAGIGPTAGAQSGASGGADGEPPTTPTLISGSRAQKTGVYALEDVDLFNILNLPGTTDVAVLTEAIAYAEERRSMILIDLDAGIDSLDEARDWINDPANSGLKHRNAVAYFPRVRIADPLQGNRLRSFANAGLMAGLYSRTDRERGVWKAPAGIDARLRGVQALDYVLSDPENGVLNPLGLNCLRSFPVFGTVSWGARTLVGADAMTSEWKYVPVRRLALFIEESLYRGTQFVVFEPNDEPLWAQIRLSVGSFMQNLFRQGALQGRTPQEAYLVRCDSSTTTQADIDLGIVNIIVGFAPLKPAEFVIIQIQQLAGQSQS